jgi:hypothetical protein
VEIIKGRDSCDNSERQFTISRREEPGFMLGQFKWEFGGGKNWHWKKKKPLFCSFLLPTSWTANTEKQTLVAVNKINSVQVNFFIYVMTEQSKGQ